MVKWLTTLGEIFLGIGIFVMFVTAGIPTEYAAVLIIISGFLIIFSYYINKKSEEAGRIITVICVTLVLAAIFAPVYTHGRGWIESGWEGEWDVDSFSFSSESVSAGSSNYFEPKDVIYLNSINGRIEVETWDGDQIRLEWAKYASNTDLLNEIEIEIEESSGKLEVKTHLPATFGNRGVNYKLFLPDKIMDELKLESTNGKISVEDVDQVSKIEIRTTNGRVEMDEIDIAFVYIHTTNAKIVIEDSRIREISAETTNGRIEVSLREMGNVSLKTTNGKICLNIPVYKNFRIDVRTRNGDIEFEPEVPLIIDEVSKNRFAGHTDSIWYVINLETTNGDIEIF